MPSFKIAIPSHRRAEGCVKKTLAFLAEHLVPPEIIHLFLEADDVPDYILPPDYRPHIIPGRPGTKGQRAAIEDFFPIGSRLICLDDDITGLKVLGCPEYNLIDLLEECFDRADENGCALWGFHPSDNGLSMKDSVTIGLKYIIGSFFGMTLKYRLEYPTNLTEDFERTIQYYLRDGRVMRFESIGIKTKYFAIGGLHEYRVGSAQADECRAFVDKYPLLCKLRERPGKPTDILIKTISLRKISCFQN